MVKVLILALPFFLFSPQVNGQEKPPLSVIGRCEIFSYTAVTFERKTHWDSQRFEIPQKAFEQNTTVKMSPEIELGDQRIQLTVTPKLVNPDHRRGALSVYLKDLVEGVKAASSQISRPEFLYTAPVTVSLAKSTKDEDQTTDSECWFVPAYYNDTSRSAAVRFIMEPMVNAIFPPPPPKK